MLCDRCADRLVAGISGYPELPDPPPPITLRSTDGRDHHLAYRVWRAPTGIEVELEESNPGEPGGGYHFAVLGAHDADVAWLVEAVTERAMAAVAVPQLVANPHRSGWRLLGDEVAGRLVWGDGRDAGGPFDVVVDGRRLTWDELGLSLEPYEGWRFRVVLEDPCDDLRPDAEVFALPSSLAEEASLAPDPGSPNIEGVLAEFLAEQEERLAPRTFRNYADVVYLLRDCLNNYGHQSLDDEELARWEAVYEREEDAFVHIFGPEKIADSLGEFLDWFMIRKVMAGEELMRAAGTVTKKLAKWLGEKGYLDRGTAAIAAKRGADAARDLPKAEKMSRLLFDYAETATDDFDPDSHDCIDDYLRIARVEPGALWFGGDIGPVKVPLAVSALARPGWSVNIVLGRSRNTWHVLEVGNVYP